MSTKTKISARPKTKRLYWGRTYPSLPNLDFISLQRESYDQFLNEGIRDLIDEVNPISDFTSKNWELSLGDYAFGKPKYTPSTALVKGVTYDMPIRIQARLLNKQTGDVTAQEVFFGEVPVMTPSGTFVINGIERAVINQLVRSAGVYFLGDIDQITGRVLYYAEVRPSFRGSWLEFNVSRNNVISVRIDRRRKFPITTFLRAVGIGSNEEIQKLFADVDPNGEFIEATLKKDVTHGSAEGAMEIYKKMRPGEPVVVETAIDFINEMFFNIRRYNLSKVGRYKMNKRLGLEIENKPSNWVLTREDIVATIKYLIRLQKGDAETYLDDIDNLANRRLRRVGELVGTVAFRAGIMRLEKAVKERMSLLDPKTKVMPNQVINARPLISQLNEFFRTSQLSAILDQTNPLSEVDTLRKISVMGVGGIQRERASFSIRDINSSQYSRICPVRSPEGPNIGLVTYLSLYARVDEYGFVLAPYRKLSKTGDKVSLTDEIVYLAADDERNFKITHAEVGLDKNNVLTDKRVPVRYKGDFIEVNTIDADLIDCVPRQVVGTAAALIPFLQHDDGVRALMGSNMQAQSVPLVKAEAPVVGTGVEAEVASALGWVGQARHDGEVVYVDGTKVVLKIAEEKAKTKAAADEIADERVKLNGNLETYFITKFKKTDTNGTSYSQKPLVKVGDMVKVGDSLIDGPASENGELALGTNLTIAYMHYEGYGYEDAIIVSDRLVREDKLTSIHIEEYDCEVVDTKLGPEELTRDIPNVGESDLANLDVSGIVVIGAEVGPNDILVGKIAPKGETELSAEERLLRAIFGEKAREVRDTSLRMPHGERGTVIGVNILDKELGDELSPGTSKIIKVKVAQMRKVSIGDKVAGRHGNKGVISRIVPVADMPYLPDGTPIDFIISPLSVIGRMNLGQLLEAHLGWAMTKSNQKVTVPVFEKISEDLITGALSDAGLPVDGKTVVLDGRTGEPFDEKVVVGTAYILKLTHMVEDKIHARSTGPYSLVTQQPLGGKAQMGGQRMGEMEVWALEAHRAAYTLQEMLTIKSDDVVGRAKAFEAIVKGTDIPQSTIPESFKVLVKELQSLGLSITPVGAIAGTPVQAPTTQITTDDNKVADKLEEAVAEETKELKEVLEMETVVTEADVKDPSLEIVEEVETGKEKQEE